MDIKQRTPLVARDCGDLLFKIFERVHLSIPLPKLDTESTGGKLSMRIQIRLETRHRVSNSKLKLRRNSLSIVPKLPPKGGISS